MIEFHCLTSNRYGLVLLFSQFLKHVLWEMARSQCFHSGVGISSFNFREVQDSTHYFLSHHLVSSDFCPAQEAAQPEFL